jgi:hypothetical protein
MKVDGYFSQLGTYVQHNKQFVLRPAECIHKQQPEDECFFKPLKSNWNEAVGIY